MVKPEPDWRSWAPALIALAAIAVSGAAWSQPQSTASIVAARHQHFKDQGRAFKTILDQLHGGSPDPAVVKAAAHTLKNLADTLPTVFPAGSGPQLGLQTRSKPEIWTDPAGFAVAMKAFQIQTAKLEAAADSGDMAAVASAAQADGHTCADCHDKYRAHED